MSDAVLAGNSWEYLMARLLVDPLGRLRFFLKLQLDSSLRGRANLREENDGAR